MSEIKISIVFSTRKIDQSFVEHLKKTCLHKWVEVLPYENNGEYSLSEIYNMGLKEAKSDIIVFCHDDIIFNTKNWGEKVIKAFNRNQGYGILGLAGTTHMVDGMWWRIRKAMHGSVKHTDGIKTWENKYSESYGNQLKEVVAVDGVFMAVHRSRIVLGFDQRFEGFHFYDIPFCVENYLEGVDVGVMSNIEIVHKSVGATNEKWDLNKKLFDEIYSEYLPICIDKENEHIVFDQTLPKVDIHVLCWNEEKIIPHFLRHYENFVNNIIVYDNKSNDNSVKILKKHPKVKIISYDTNGEIRDDAYLTIKNNGWKQSKNADIVIVCDMDEFLHSDDLGQYLRDFNESKATIIKPIGFEMMIKDFDLTKSGLLLADVTHGYEHDHFNKFCIFKPSEINEINYNFGCHVASPKGNVVFYDKPIKLLHLKKIGLNYFLEKMKAYHNRLSKFNRDRALGYQYDFSPEKHEDMFISELEKVKKVL
jgi:glycosyltransferase involved in cell wall biosynthesis